MQRSLEFLDSDLLRLMTAALDAAVAASITSHADIDDIRFTAARHIQAAVDAGERDCQRLEHSALAHIRSLFNGCAPLVGLETLPSPHRTSA